MKIIKNIRDVLIALVLFILCVLCYSQNWFLSTWDSSIEFSTIVYQLLSPLKGTGKEVMQSYINSCIYPSVFKTGIILIIYCICHDFRRKFIYCWKIKIGRKRISFYTGCWQEKALNYIVLTAVFCVMCFFIWQQAALMGVVDYIEHISQRSTIFEEEYVDPKEVTISFPEKKRNLILIYLESMETTYASVEAGGGKKLNYIPELTKLAQDNIYFSNDEDLGGASASSGTGWTMAALLASSTGVPYKLGISGNTADRYEKFLPGITSMGDILLDNGYQNYFMCGSDISFAGRKDFYLQHGDYTLVDINKLKEKGAISADYHNGFWGIEDEKLFAMAREKLSDIGKESEPFNFTLLTVDTHHPDGYICDFCEEQYDEQFANALACSSRQTFEFIEWVKEQDWYENTSIVITGDHLSMKGDFWDDVGGYERKIYNCFINSPGDLEPVRTQNRIFTIVDLFPSILATLDAEIDGERLGLGVNLFSEEMTIPEKMGIDEFNNELEDYSQYYFQHFIVGI